MTAPDPPHPGPRPEAFTFPFAEGHAALVSMEAELDDLAACVRVHEDAGGELCAITEGASAQAFEAWLASALARLRVERQQLADDVDALRARLALAEQQRADREQAIRTWQRRMDAYRSHQQADAV